MSGRVVVAGSASPRLGSAIAKELSCGCVQTETKFFPDGEVYVRIPSDVSDKEVVYVQTMQTEKYQPNEALIEYILTTSTLKEIGARKVTGVTPYMAYSRQDNRFNEGEAVSARIVASTIAAAGTDEFISVNSHVHVIGELPDIFPIPAKNLDAMGEISSYFDSKYGLVDPLVIAPDSGALRYAQTAAERIGGEAANLTKKRADSHNVEQSLAPDIRVKARDVVIVDDIISTGGTIVGAVSLIKERKPNRVFVGTTHALLVEGALSRIQNAGAVEVAATDSIECAASKVSLARLIAENL